VLADEFIETPFLARAWSRCSISTPPPLEIDPTLHQKPSIITIVFMFCCLQCMGRELGSAHQKEQRAKIIHKTNPHENGENAYLSQVASVGQVRARPIDKLDEACTNADDQMILVQHHSGDRVMS